MSKSLSPELTKKAERFIKEAVEPKISEVITEMNVMLEKYGIQIGADIKWLIDKKQEKKK